MIQNWLNLSSVKEIGRGSLVSFKGRDEELEA